MHLTFGWDDLSAKQIGVFEHQADAELGQAIWNMMQDAGEASVSFIRPLMVGNGTWQPSSGALASSLRFNVSATGNAYTVDFYADAKSDDGKYYQQYMDVGNFPANVQLWADEFGMNAFPISLRAGAVTVRLDSIHGMGNSSPDSPRQFSDKAVKHMTDELDKIADKHMQKLLDRVVISR